MNLFGLKRTVLLAALLMVGVLVAAAACGGDDDDNGTNGDGTETEAPDNGNGDNGNGDGEEVTIDVSMGDNFFEPSEFTVPADATVTINLTNDGAAIHNMRFAGEDNEFNTGDDAVSDPSTVAAGDTATLTFTAPSEAGEFGLLCDFHPTDMTGTLTVE